MPKPNLTTPNPSQEEIERFWSQVDKTPGQGPKGECWIFKTRSGKKYRSGKPHYGQITLSKNHVPPFKLRVSRFVYFLTTGESLGEFMACHRCDWPPCCHPDHIFKGTQKENSEDAAQKGHYPHGDKHHMRLNPEKTQGDKHWTRQNPEWVEHMPRGEAHPNSKLTEAGVIRILTTQGQTQLLARELNVSPRLIRCVRKREIWKHVVV